MVDIPINAAHRRKQYVSSGNVGPFSFSFAILAEADISVKVGTTLKTLTTHYTVTINANGTGSITFTGGNAPAAGAIVTLQSNQPIERTTDFTTGGDFRAATVNDEFDRLTISVQQLETWMRRNIQLADSANRDVSKTGIGPLVLPLDDTASNNANKVITFDTAGTALLLNQEIGQFRGDWAASTSYNLRDIVRDTNNGNTHICIVAHSSTGALPILSNSDAAKWGLLVDGVASSASAAAASTSATNSANSATASANSATASANSATASASSASSSATESAAAVTAKNAAETAKAAAETAKTNAETSETNAAASATAAAASSAASTTAKTASETAETNSANSATASANSATASATSATSSASSASAALSSANAAEAAAAAIFFNFETSTTMGNPSSGGVRFNNASMGSVTQIAFSATAASTGSPDVSDFIATWDDSTNPAIKGHLVIRESGAPGSVIVFAVSGTITDNTTHLIVPVSHVSSAGVSLAANDDLFFAFSRAGNSGSGTGDLLASNNLSDVANAGTSRTNLGLGTAAVLNAGTSANNVVQLDGSGNLPALDGSALTGAGGPGVTAGTDEFIRENAPSISSNVSISANRNAFSAGPISISGSATLTIPSNSRYHVIG